ncbi:MAG: hypothetical protein CBC48_05320 [bacterium TMED88]|nr:MAG: hypothetical protein CBC48_05320 [bacterium TMED88]
MFTIIRSSNAVNFIVADALTGTVKVQFANSVAIYEYTNVSRRAIINLALNKNISLGFWVNCNCFESRVQLQSFA